MQAFDIISPKEWRQLYEPLPSAVPEATVIRDIRYGPAQRNLLDIYVPMEHIQYESTRAVLLFMHGGGFFSGDKAWSLKVCEVMPAIEDSAHMSAVLGQHRTLLC